MLLRDFTLVSVSKLIICNWAELLPSGLFYRDFRLELKFQEIYNFFLICQGFSELAINLPNTKLI